MEDDSLLCEQRSLHISVFVSLCKVVVEIYVYICVDMDEHVAMWQLSPLVLISTYWDKDFAVLIRIKGTKNEMRGNRKLDAKKRLTDREMER